MIYQFALTEQQLQVVIGGLGELPLKISGPVFSALQEQQRQQEAAAQSGGAMASHETQ